MLRYKWTKYKLQEMKSLVVFLMLFKNVESFTPKDVRRTFEKYA